MSIFGNIARMASDHLRARAERRTQILIEGLPESVQKDIGWRWAPRTRGQHKSGTIGFVGQ